MKRGEVWTYAPSGLPRRQSVVIVSSDGINESPRPWLLAVVLVDDDPGDILAVPVPELGWTYAGSVSRVYRPWLTEQTGDVPQETVDRIDGALRAALDL